MLVFRKKKRQKARWLRCFAQCYIVLEVVEECFVNALVLIASSSFFVLFFKAAASIESDAEDDGGDREDKLEKLKTLAFGLFGDEAKQVEKGRKRLNASGVESNTFAKNLARFESGKKKKENIDEERRTRRSVDNNEDDIEQVDARTTEEVTFTD